MSRIWQPQPIEIYKEWVRMILDEASDDLNSWETDFIDSIDTQLSANRNLSEKQAEKLESIYADKTK